MLEEVMIQLITGTKITLERAVEQIKTKGKLRVATDRDAALIVREMNKEKPIVGIFKPRAWIYEVGYYRTIK